MRVHISDVVAELYLLPNLFVRHVLNLLLSDCFYYTKSDIRKQPFLYATIGWIIAYTIFCMLSPILVFLSIWKPTFIDLTFVNISVIYGCAFWFYLLIIGIEVLVGFLKRLTRKIFLFAKQVLGLQSEKELKLDEYNKSAKVCRL